MPEKKGIVLTCHRCGHTWTYTGYGVTHKYKNRTPCGICQASVKIKKEKTNEMPAESQKH